MKYNKLLVNNLIKVYEKSFNNDSYKLILDNIDIELNPNKIKGLIGLNGSGKTTLFKTLSGESTVTLGDVYLEYEEDNILNKVYADPNILREKVRTVISGDLINPFFNLIDLVEYTLSVNNKGTLEDAENYDRFVWLCTSLGIDNRFFNYTSAEYSKGMKQKCSLICSFMCKGDFYLLDEPFVGLDALSVNFLENLIKEINKKDKASVLVTSHSIANLTKICNEIYILQNGKIINNIDLDIINKENYELFQVDFFDIKNSEFSENNNLFLIHINKQLQLNIFNSINKFDNINNFNNEIKFYFEIVYNNIRMFLLCKNQYKSFFMNLFTNELNEDIQKIFNTNKYKMEVLEINKELIGKIIESYLEY